MEIDRLLAARREHDDPSVPALEEARALWRAARWPEATRRFGEIATAHPGGDTGIVAAMFYLEGLHLLATEVNPPRTSCLDEMAESLPRLQNIHCEKGQSQRHASECHLLYRIERDLERVGESGGHEAPDVPTSAAYARAGESYLLRAVRCMEVTRLARVSPLADRCDDLAFYAVRAFINVPDDARAAQARALLLDPRNGMLESPRVTELPGLRKRDGRDGPM